MIMSRFKIEIIPPEKILIVSRGGVRQKKKNEVDDFYRECFKRQYKSHCALLKYKNKYNVSALLLNIGGADTDKEHI